MAPFDDLVTHIQEFHTSWARQTIFYATISLLLRVTLIISTAIVGAEKTLQQAWCNKHEAWFSILAVAVAIITALDAWLKPREKWRGFMSDRDEAQNLLMKVQAADHNDLGIYSRLLEEFHVIQQRHVEKNVY